MLCSWANVHNGNTFELTLGPYNLNSLSSVQAHVDHALQAVPTLLGVAEDFDFEGQEERLVAEFQGKLSAQSAEAEQHLKQALETIRSNPFWTHEQKRQFMDISIGDVN